MTELAEDYKKEAARLRAQYPEPVSLGHDPQPTYEKAWLSFIIKEQALLWFVINFGRVVGGGGDNNPDVPYDPD